MRILKRKQQDMYKATPLMLAVTLGYSDIVRLLLDHHADSNIVVEEGNLGPLKQAVLNGNAVIVKMLLNAGAEYGVMDEEGTQIWDRAKRPIHTLVIKEEKNQLRKQVEEQDWQPEELLSLTFLEDIMPLKQIICDYAHVGFFADEEKDQYIENQIACNKKEKSIVTLSCCAAVQRCWSKNGAKIACSRSVVISVTY